MTIINQTDNGKVFRCPSCNKIHIEYKNLEFLFDHTEYKFFCDYFKNLNGEYWENLNAESIYKRKIIIPIGHKNIRILLFSCELDELKCLLSARGNNQKNRIARIDLTTCCN
jgi:hypothetical protein